VVIQEAIQQSYGGAANNRRNHVAPSVDMALLTPLKNIVVVAQSRLPQLGID